MCFTCIVCDINVCAGCPVNSDRRDCKTPFCIEWWLSPDHGAHSENLKLRVYRRMCQSCFEDVESLQRAYSIDAYSVAVHEARRRRKEPAPRDALCPACRFPEGWSDYAARFPENIHYLVCDVYRKTLDATRKSE